MPKRSGKKKKESSKNKNVAKPGNVTTSRGPKSMVIRVGAGEVGPSVSQLVQDVRTMMEPDTAVRLKVSATKYLSMSVLINVGKKIKSIKRLHNNGWASWCIAFAAFLKIKDWKYKSANSPNTERAYFTFSSGILFPLQGCKEGNETSYQQ